MSSKVKAQKNAKSFSQDRTTRPNRLTDVVQNQPMALADPAQNTWTAHQPLTPTKMQKLQRTIGNRAVSKLLMESAQRQEEPKHANHLGLIGSAPPGAIQRIKIKVTVPKKGKGSAEEEIETDERSLAELCSLHNKNKDNKALNDEIARRAEQATPEDIIDLFRSDDAPSSEKHPSMPAIRPAVQRWLQQIQSAKALLEMLGAMAALKLCKGFPDLVPKELFDLAKEAQKTEAQQKKKESASAAQERARLEQARLAEFVTMFSGLLMRFVVQIPSQFSSSQLIKALSRLDTAFRTSNSLQEAVTMANGILDTINLLMETMDEGDMEGPGPMNREGHDVVAEFEMEQRRRRQAAEKVLSRHFPAMVGCLKRADPACIVYQRYRGSLADGLKNEQKSIALGAGQRTLVRVINLHSFDCDAFLEIDADTWNRWVALELFPQGPAVKSGKIGIRSMPGFLKFVANNELKGSARGAMAQRLLTCIEELLKLEHVIQMELAEIAGYKMSEQEDVGDFGMMVQSSETTAKQSRQGKRYPFDQLAALHLQLTDLLHMEVTMGESGASTVAVALIEEQRTIEHAGTSTTLRTRPRSKTK